MQLKQLVISALVFGVSAIASADSRTVVYVSNIGTNAEGR